MIKKRTKNLKKRGLSNGKRKKTFRSKTYFKKKARVKRLEKPKQGLARRVKTTRRTQSKNDRGSVSKTKSRITRRTTKTARFTPKLLKKGYSEIAKKVSKTFGYSSKIRIKKSKFVKGNTLILKKSETNLAKNQEIKLSKNRSVKKEVLKRFSKIAKKKFKTLGKSKENLRLIKLQYTYSINGKRRKSYFSSTVAKIRNEDEVILELEDLISAFEKKQHEYISAGFSNIHISGIRMHAYEDEPYNFTETEEKFVYLSKSKKKKKKKKKK